MNIEFLPEADHEGAVPRDAAEEIPAPQIHNSERSKRILSVTVALSCFILCSVGLLLHGAAICKLADELHLKGRDILISSVLPGAEVHLPSPVQINEDESNQKDSGSTKQPDDNTPTAEYMSADLSSAKDRALDINNETSYEPDITALYAGERPVSVMHKNEAGKDPLVLIYHTHGTEAYAESAADSFRSRDTSKNVIAVGAVISDVLGEAGIGAIHLEEMFDSENWSAAYDKSTVAVRNTLKKYPSIKYIFDVHRDCIGSDEIGYIRSLAVYGGTETAQLMFVCGTDQGGSGHVTWQKNLAFALQLQGKLWTMSKNLMRPVDLRSASFYQDTGNGALLAEFGTCANSLTEAKRGAVLFASALADYIYGESCNLDCEALFTRYCN